MREERRRKGRIIRRKGSERSKKKINPDKKGRKKRLKETHRHKKNAAQHINIFNLVCAPFFLSEGGGGGAERAAITKEYLLITT